MVKPNHKVIWWESNNCKHPIGFSSPESAKLSVHFIMKRDLDHPWLENLVCFWHGGHALLYLVGLGFPIRFLNVKVSYTERCRVRRRLKNKRGTIALRVRSTFTVGRRRRRRRRRCEACRERTHVRRPSPPTTTTGMRRRHAFCVPRMFGGYILTFIVKYTTDRK